VSSDDDGGYVHRPGQGRETDDDGRVEAEPTDAASPDETGVTTPEPDDSLGRFGWALVTVVAVAFLGIPGVIYLFPAGPQSGLPFLVAMLALPFAPALLLGVVAVWTAVTDGDGR
jgi:hypothetical protein